jgi:hypothetical protein
MRQSGPIGAQEVGVPQGASLAKLLKTRHRRADTIQAYQKVIEIDPRDQDAHKELEELVVEQDRLRGGLFGKPVQ